MLGDQGATDGTSPLAIFDGLLRGDDIAAGEVVADPVIGVGELPADHRRRRGGPGDALGHPGRLIELGAGVGVAAEQDVNVVESDQRLDGPLVNGAAGGGGGARRDLAQAGPGNSESGSG